MLNYAHKHCPIVKNQAGFTVVELIVAMVLMAIVGAVVFTRYMSSSAFNPVGAQDAILTITQAAQQASLGRGNVSFEIDSNGGRWSFSVIEDGSVLRSASVSVRNVNLETGSAAASGSTCTSAFDTPVANDFELNFDSKGDLVDFTNNSTTETVDSSFNGVRICVNDDVNLSVCVSPAGYAYEGSCDA